MNIGMRLPRHAWLRTRGLAFGIAVLAALLAASIVTQGAEARGKAAATKSPVHLALIGDSAAFLDQASPLKAGAYAARDYINKELGGFGGRPLRLNFCDARFDLAATKVCAQKTISPKPIAQVGYGVSWGLGGLPLFKAAKIPSIQNGLQDPDLTDPWNIAIPATGIAEEAAKARYFCSKKAKSVLFMSYDVPYIRKSLFSLGADILRNCGAKVTTIFANQTTTDFTPDVAKILRAKPDYASVSLGTAALVQVIRGLRRSGYPANRIYLEGGHLSKNFLSGIGALGEGIHFSSNFANPDNPAASKDVAVYRRAMAKYKGGFITDGLKQWSFSQIMTVWRASQKVGFAKVTGASLHRYLTTKSGLRSFMQGPLQNPGPIKRYPSIKYEGVQLLRLKGGKLVNVYLNKKTGNFVTNTL